MTERYLQGPDDHRIRSGSIDETSGLMPQPNLDESSPGKQGAGTSLSHTALANPQVAGRGNGSARAATVQRMQATHGNRAVQRWSAGWEPAEQDERGGQKYGPHLYARSTGRGGLDLGYALSSGVSPNGGVPVGTSLLYGQARIGGWEEDGSTQYGLQANRGLFRTEVNPGGKLSGDLGISTDSLDANVGGNGLRLGYGASLAEGSVTAGNFSRDDTADSSMRFGMGAGAGMGARLHWGDSDRDGQREYGFGFDGGLFSLDYKSEDPIRSALAGVYGGLLGDPFGMCGADAALKKQMGGANMTDEALALPGKAVNSAASSAHDLIQVMTNMAGPGPSFWPF